MLSSVAAILLFIFLFGRSELIEIKTFSGNSGLHFEETGSIRFYKDEWKIIASVDLTKYKNELDIHRSNVALIRNCCKEFNLIEMENNSSKKGSEGCGPILNQLNIAMSHIENNDDTMVVKDKRFKRNAVSDFIFNDWSEDQFLIQDEFKKMSVEGAQKSTKAKNKTSFISSTLNFIVRSSQQNQTSNGNFIRHKLSVLLSALSAVKNGSVNVVQLFQLRNTIDEVISYQNHILSTFTLKQKQYLNIVSLVGQRNPVIPNILPSNIFTDELNLVREIASQTGLDLPMQITSENLFFFYHISHPEIQMLNDQIYISFRIPLISQHSSNRFSLIKVTSSLYSIRDDLYSFINPNHEFIAVDEQKEHYTTLTTQDFQNCYQSNILASVICQQTVPIMSTLVSDECEINLLRKDERKSSCNVRFIKNNADIFVKVLQPNSYLLTLPKNKTANYMCDGKPTQDFLLRSGLLTIDSDCKLATENVLIMGHNTFPKSKIYEHPNVKVHSFDDNFIDNILSNNLNPPMHVNDITQVVNFGENEKLLRISYTVDDIKIKILIEEIENYSNSKYSLFLNRSALVFFIASFLFFFLILFTQIRCSKRQPQKINLVKETNGVNVQTKPSAPMLVNV